MNSRPLYVLILEWSHDGKPQDCLSKPIPHLLPVGTRVFLNDDDGYLDDLAVKEVCWFEGEGGFFQITLAPIRLEGGTAAEQLAWLKSLGWQEEVVYAEDCQAARR